MRTGRSGLVLLPLVIVTLACGLASPLPTLTPFPTTVATITLATTSIASGASPTAPAATMTRATGCVPNTSGVAYRIQPGDTVSALAARTNTTTNNLVTANCLVNANSVAVGQIIYLPRVPATYMPSPLPTDTRSMQILQVIPSDGSDPYDRYVHPNTTVTLSVATANVTSVTFLANEAGQPTYSLGISANLVSPATLLWQVPDRLGLSLFLSAQGTTTTGELVSTPGLVRVTVVGINTSCSGAPTPRLRVGGLAFVTLGLPSTLRSGPGKDNPSVNQLAAGTELLVLGGPTCVNGLNWWQVNCAACSNIQIGWTAEGQGATYFLQPEPNPGSTN